MNNRPITTLNNRPITTLFMLMSVDGKISTGDTDDFDKDLCKINKVKDGLQQYYAVEQTTDLWSLCTGKVHAKLGINSKELADRTPVSFVVIDNNHLTEHGIQYLSHLSKEFVLITSNKNHPALNINETNIHVIYQKELNLSDALERLKLDLGCERLTIQSGSTLNGLFLREQLIDYVDIVVAPILVGGKDTPALIGGKSIQSLRELGVLQLIECKVLNNSYIRLRYKVLNNRR